MKPLLLSLVVAHAAVPRLPARIAPPTGRAAPALSLSGPKSGGSSSLRMSRDVARDEVAAKLSAAGLPDMLKEEGLVLWHILPAKTRGGERLFLTVGLPLDGRPFERGSGAPERRAELERRLAAVEARVVSEAARVLGMPEDMVAVSGRLVETCCGAGCQSCLLTKPEHSQRWTGLPSRSSPR